MLKSVSLKQALNKIGVTNIELKKNYYYQSGFFELKGELYYICSSDVRMPIRCVWQQSYSDEIPVFYRVAKHRKDFVGGRNLDFNKLAHEYGMKITKVSYTT